MSLATAAARERKTGFGTLKTASVFAEKLKDRFPSIDDNVISLVARQWKGSYGPAKKAKFNADDYRQAISEVEADADKNAKLAVSILGPKGAEVLKEVMLDVLENYDGSGPRGKTGDQIRPEAFVFKFARTVDNILQKMPNRYRTGDSDSVFENVIALQEHYPPGMIQRLIPVIENLLKSANPDPKTMELAELGRVSRGLYHDATEYISTLHAQLEIIQMNLDNPAMIKESAEAGMQTIQAFLSFRNHLVALGKGELQKTNNDLNKTIDDALALLDHKLRSVDIEKSCAKLPKCAYYEIPLRQVFVNLIKNAAEATNLAGKITIKTSAQGTDIVVSISDNGQGMSGSQIEAVFSGLTTKQGGNGVGTQWCEYVMDRHNGVISYESEKGVGTTVTLRLPVESVSDQKTASAMAQKFDIKELYFVASVAIAGSDEQEIFGLVRDAIGATDPARVLVEKNSLFDRNLRMRYTLHQDRSITGYDGTPIWQLSVTQATAEYFSAVGHEKSTADYAKKVAELARKQGITVLGQTSKVELGARTSKGYYIPVDILKNSV